MLNKVKCALLFSIQKGANYSAFFYICFLYQLYNRGINQRQITHSATCRRGG